MLGRMAPTGQPSNVERTLLVHPEFVFFDAILREANFYAPDELPRSIKTPLSACPKHPFWPEVVEVGRRLPDLRERANGAKSVRAFQAVRLNILHHMGAFQDACANFRSVFRPIFWRYFWEGERPSLLHWVPRPSLLHSVPKRPRHFRSDACPAFLLHYLTMGEEDFPSPYAVLWFDPRTFTAKDFQALKDDCRDALGEPRTKSGSFREFPRDKRRIRGYLLTLNHTIRGERFSSIRNNDISSSYPPARLRELREAWNSFLLGKQAPEGLVRAFLEQFQRDVAEKEDRWGSRKKPITSLYVQRVLNELRPQLIVLLRPVELPT